MPRDGHPPGLRFQSSRRLAGAGLRTRDAHTRARARAVIRAPSAGARTPAPPSHAVACGPSRTPQVGPPGQASASSRARPAPTHSLPGPRDPRGQTRHPAAPRDRARARDLDAFDSPCNITNATDSGFSARPAGVAFTAMRTRASKSQFGGGSRCMSSYTKLAVTRGLRERPNRCEHPSCAACAPTPRPFPAKKGGGSPRCPARDAIPRAVHHSQGGWLRGPLPRFF